METEFVRQTEPVKKNRRSSFFQRRISLSYRTGGEFALIRLRTPIPYFLSYSCL